jgi:hypothetical protein
MPWTIKFLETPMLHEAREDSPHYDGTIDFYKMVVGDMCFFHYQGKPCTDRARLDKLHLTAYYFANNVNRPPLILALPDAAYPNGKLYFMVDGQCFSNTCTRCGQGRKCVCPPPATIKGYYDGWTVSGAPPLITVQPSVNYDDDEYGIKHYHGFISNGVIGDG